MEWECVCTYVCAHMFTYVYGCTCVFPCEGLCRCVFTYKCVSGSIRVCVGIRVCVCPYTCECVSETERSQNCDAFLITRPLVRSPVNKINNFVVGE